jgi:hypothetical protein
MAPWVVDAEALREFLDQAAPYLTDAAVLQLQQDLDRRHQWVQSGPLPWTDLWQRAPVGRRIERGTRIQWAPRLEPVLSALWQGEVEALWTITAEEPQRPFWLIDWGTYWLHLVHPHWVWWARWLYRPDVRTGAILLVVDDAGKFDSGCPDPVLYRQIMDTTSFLGEVLNATHRLDAIDEKFRPQVALAVVYAVYMFTMAAWKLTQEFTQVLPSFLQVVRALLGLNRWEGHGLGPESKAP